MKKIICRLAAKCLEPFIVRRVKINRELRRKYAKAFKEGTMFIKVLPKGPTFGLLRFEYMLQIIPALVEEGRINFRRMQKLMATRRRLRRA